VAADPHRHSLRNPATNHVAHSVQRSRPSPTPCENHRLIVAGSSCSRISGAPRLKAAVSHCRKDTLRRWGSGNPLLVAPTDGRDSSIESRRGQPLDAVNQYKHSLSVHSENARKAVYSDCGR
jgi:hypothetical protein